MAIRTALRSLLLALAVVTAAGAAFAGAAEAKNKGYWSHPIYNERQGWAHVDKNRDGRISSSEWRWAKNNGYDRLNGVPKRNLTRGEYQRYLSAYLDQRNRNWHGNNDWDRDDDRRSDGWRRNNQGRYDQGPYMNDDPWRYNPNGGGGKH